MDNSPFLHTNRAECTRKGSLFRLIRSNFNYSFSCVSRVLVFVLVVFLPKNELFNIFQREALDTFHGFQRDLFFPT